MKIIKITIFIFILLLARDKCAFAMHISEGILPFKWALLWYAAALPFIIKGIFDIKRKAKTSPAFKSLLGLMGALVFIISCMPIPVPTAGTCSHPCGTGISAILLGPVISVFITSIVLFLQAMFLAHGGITTWGADIVSMGIAGSFAGYLAFRILRRFNLSLFISGFAAGLLADWATYTATSFELAAGLSGGEPIFPLFMTILAAFIPTQIPLGILEGFMTGGIMVFVYRRRPDILEALNVIVKSKIPASTKLQNNFDGRGLAVAKKGEGGKNQKAKLHLKIQKLQIFIAGLIFCVLSLNLSYAKEAPRWSGVDENVVEKIAEEHGRAAWTPFINTDQGDLLLFVFLLAGVIGGFVLGFYFRKLFIERNDLKDVE